MIRKILLLLFLFGNIYLSAQNEEQCGSTIQNHQNMMEQNPEYKKHHENWLKKIAPIIAKRKLEKNPDCSGGKILVPIAVHFDNGLVPAAQEACVIDVVVDQINEVNAEFAGMDIDAPTINNFTACFGADILGDACLEFCLASQNHPSGSGLIEGEYAVTFGTVSFNIPGGNNTPVNAAWSDYVNVYVDNLPGGLLGVSNGIPGNFNGDGVMVDNCVFGTGNLSCSGVQLTGSAGCFALYDEGETLAHELGHYFGLYHIWGDNSSCGGFQDGIADTPNMATNYSGYTACTNDNNCADLPQTCSSEDMYMNFMSYASDGCMYMFTSDQSDLMNATAVTEGFTTSSTKCSDPLPVADFDPSGPISLCSNLCIDFTDQTSNNPDSWDWLFTVASGNITTNITSSTAQNPTVCITSGTSGTLNVKLTAENAAGAHDTTKALIITITPPQTWYQDFDMDSYGNNSVQQLSCTMPAGYVANNIDCDDNDANNFPGNIEICDGQDNNCNGLVDDDDPNVIAPTWYRDFDGDDFGDETIFLTQCVQPLGYVSDNSDCDDMDANNYPGNVEVCDFQDNDCDGLVDDADPSLDGTIYYEDADNDGFGDNNSTINTCDPPPGFVLNNTDCNDNDNTVYPDAPELCDGIINDCNSASLEGNEVDDDGDGFVECTIDAGGWDGVPSVVGGDDCDDNDGTKFPGAPELCDGIINDCNSASLEANEVDDDGDGFVECTIDAGGWDGVPSVIGGDDCDDNETNNFPGNTEVCDGIDNNCDDVIDEGCSLSNCDDDSLYVSSIMQNAYHAMDYLWSDATILNTEDILFTAGIDIDLAANFEVEPGAIFEARIESCNVLFRMHPQAGSEMRSLSVQLEAMGQRLLKVESENQATVQIINSKDNSIDILEVGTDNFGTKLLDYMSEQASGIYYLKHTVSESEIKIEKLVWIR